MASLVARVREARACHRSLTLAARDFRIRDFAIFARDLRLSEPSSMPPCVRIIPRRLLQPPAVQDAIEKADVLIEAMGWIRQFRDKITVIKLGGSVMEDPEALRHLLVDIVFMETVGMRPIVVHGGGAAISRAMAEAKLEPRFIQGRRYTDDATLKIVERVLAGEINESIAARIEELRRPGDAAQLCRRAEQQRAVRRTADAAGRRWASRSTWGTSAT